jgi:regulator of replication initiation timing
MTPEKDENKFEKLVALTTSFVAVGLAISTILNNAAGDDLLVFRSDANNKWSYFQSKSIKQNMVEIEHDNLSLEIEDETLTETFKTKIREKQAFYKEEIKRYESEKAQISKEAKEAEDKMEKADKKGLKLDLAEALYQISIIMSAIALIAKNKSTWYMSLALGIGAVSFTCYAHFLMP